MKQVLIILSFIFLLSCEEKIEIEPIANNKEIIAIDGIITNEKKQHLIKISYLSGHINQVPDPVSGAAVFISNGDTSFILRELLPASGVYFTDSIRAVTGKKYQLTIDFGNKTFFAIADIEPVTPLFHASYISTRENFYQLIPNTSTNAPAMWEYIIDWSGVGPINDEDSLMKVRLLYYNLGNIDVPQVFATGKEAVEFPAGSVIYEKKYSLTQAHANFLRSLLLETEWTGGNFDAAHANLLTNFSSGAIGFFGACTVVSDSILVLP